MTTPAAPERSAREAIVAYFKDFGILRETRSEYWGIQLVNFLDCTAYFAILTIAALTSAWLAAQWLAGTMKGSDDD